MAEYRVECKKKAPLVLGAGTVVRFEGLDTEFTIQIDSYCFDPILHNDSSYFGLTITGRIEFTVVEMET